MIYYMCKINTENPGLNKKDGKIKKILWTSKTKELNNKYKIFIIINNQVINVLKKILSKSFIRSKFYKSEFFNITQQQFLKTSF